MNISLLSQGQKPLPMANMPFFQMVGNPDWPFGSTTVKITIEETGSKKKLKVIDTSIQDDGGILREYNWDVVWQDDSVKIILKGSEQEDAVHTVMLK